MPDLKVLTEAGSFAVVIWIVWYVFSRAIPAFVSELSNQREQFKQMLKESHESHKQSLELVVRSHSENLADLSKQMDRLRRNLDRQREILLRHDLTVRGINPHIVGPPLSQVFKPTEEEDDE